MLGNAYKALFSMRTYFFSSITKTFQNSYHFNILLLYVKLLREHFCPTQILLKDLTTINNLPSIPNLPFTKNIAFNSF